MKILQISDTILNVWWAEKVIYDLKNLLEKKNHSVFIWWTKEEKIHQSIFSIFNIKYYFILKNYLKNNTFHVIHIHKFNSILSPSIFLAIYKNSKVILHIHDFSFYCPKLWVTKDWKECKWWIFHFNCNRPIERNFILNFIFDFIKWLKFIINRYFIKKYVDVFICPSKKLQEYMIKSLKLPKEKVIYLPNFIDIEKKHQLNFENINDKKFLYVWRVSKEKWIEVAIKAFDILVNKEWIKDIYFEVIWDWPEKQSLEYLTKSLWLENNIKFLWKIDNSDLQKYYESSISLIMPSVWLENNPLVAIEWMKYWKTIIASNIWWFSDLVENWKNGYLFKIWNYKELAEKIKNLYKNKKISIKMWRYWFEKLEKDFNSKNYFNILLNIYK